MNPNLSSYDPPAAFPDVVAALALAVRRLVPPAHLKERLDERLGEFARDRQASFDLLSRPADRLRTRLLTGPGSRRRAKGSPLARLDTDGSGDGELPYLRLSPGPPLSSVALRRTDSGETVLAAKL